ncbi:MAG TPA: radical SAM protein [Thermoanaerobaculia bacterium]|nr:radical SAM protein [Thermoanaerobaculia bacterium]
MPKSLSTEEKIRILIAQADRDAEGQGGPGVGASRFRARQPLDPFNIRNLSDRGFGATRIFRILLTNACAFDCAYCPMRAGRDLPRHALSPALLADAFLTAYQKRWADGLFVTSGIPKNPRWAMDRMIELVEILRFQHHYAGYLHAKAVSGAEPEQVERLALLCDRISYNLEVVCQATLERVAPEKSYARGIELLERVRAVAQNAGPRRLAGDPRPPGAAVAAGATTQIVVGLGNETDREVLAATQRLWREKTIHHPHFAAFRPIESTPLENAPETPSAREQRLYQADYLLRRYGFGPEELVYRESGNLPLSRDPKLTWALAHPDRFPVEITTAAREDLLRVPGVGPRSAGRLLELRRGAANVTAADVRHCGAAAARAAGFLSWRGRVLGERDFQDPLFTPEDIPQKSRIYDFSPGTFR